ncbi:MAG: DUF484 family protein [Woeseiaceae bacterium]
MSNEELEVRKLRQQMRLMRDKAKQNENLLKRSQQRELDVLAATSLTDLIDRLTVGLSESYKVDTATIVLCDPDHEIRHLMMAEGGRLRRPEAIHFVDALTGVAPQYSRLYRPWLGAFSAADHQLIFPQRRFASIAMIGLRRQGKLIGSINLASHDADRYQRGLASDFLGHLGVIASFAIENAVNRARLLRSGFTDVLTGWHNRRYLQIRLEEEFSRADRQNFEMSCLFLDLDHFKQVNDSHGHQAGDVVLAECASRIDAEVRSSDVAARFGGEEFVILLPDTELRQAQLLAERILAAVNSKPIALPDGPQLNVTVSIGVASIRPHGMPGDHRTLGEQLLKLADLAMYSAKSAGRNCVRVADQST